MRQALITLRAAYKHVCQKCFFAPLKVIAKMHETQNMSELFKIVLTSCFTILGGIIVLVIGQIITKFLLNRFMNNLS